MAKLNMRYFNSANKLFFLILYLCPKTSLSMLWCNDKSELKLPFSLNKYCLFLQQTYSNAMQGKNISAVQTS